MLNPFTNKNQSKKKKKYIYANQGRRRGAGSEDRPSPVFGGRSVREEISAKVPF